MFEFLKRRLKSEKGSMDRILVTFFLIVLGIAIVAGLQFWMQKKSPSLGNSLIKSQSLEEKVSSKNI
ncbi:hypothetical protein [Halarcobacter anaerophilus]|uniref:Uncharacterized protein n=1 Tax=Halarcobacter anaerophilus TaxID=877500 RepID=A0A4Q0Y271_9BACT|nr:hypothetical protein [Halarcobacter anaerophilus]QDF27870.1 hypothetical protein AANAER_0368 [Halarcobacter anaerophilus]RXJ64207.1 hypothetical protein CRV06_04540 [Halarcobacter anaerophilus]